MQLQYFLAAEQAPPQKIDQEEPCAKKVSRIEPVTNYASERDPTAAKEANACEGARGMRHQPEQCMQ